MVISGMQVHAKINPKVSLVVPAYSRPDLLRECLASIKRQTETDLECIVVDDASPHGLTVQRVVAELDDNRFSYVRRTENGGPAAARNTGIRAAVAEFFMCVDEDDRLLPQAVEILFREAVMTGADAVCPQAAFFGGREGIRKAKEPRLDLMLTGMRLLPNGWIMKKAVWEKTGGYDEDPRLKGRDDWEIWLRVLALGASVKVLEEVLYEYRVPAGGLGEHGSLEHEVREREVSCMNYVIRKHWSLYKSHPIAVRALRLRSCRTERMWHEKHGHFFKAALRAIQSAVYEESRKEKIKEIQRATILVMKGALGGKIVRR